MAAESVRLAEAHRLAQHRLGVETVRISGALYSMLDLTNLDATTPRWLQAMVPAVLAQHRRSSRLAADYMTSARWLDLGPDPSWRPVLAAPSVDRIVASLHVTGPVRARALSAEGVGLATARRTVATTSSRSAMRLALGGGRETVLGTAAAERRQAWWSRVSSGQPCAFCAMLVSRGPAYRTQATGGFQAHDGCACSVMVTYDSETGWTDQAREYRRIWDSTEPGTPSSEALSAFRRAIEAPAVALPLAA